jgi:hypothetical protein
MMAWKKKVSIIHTYNIRLRGKRA